MKNLELSIVIVNYNKYELTIKCIESVLQHTKEIDFEIIVMDNCSTNSSFDYLKEHFGNKENVHVFQNSSNTGFGDGNNKAVEKSKFNNIMFLNPDVLVLDNGIKELLEVLTSRSDVGIVGCKLLNQDMTLQYSCRRILPIYKFILARTPLQKFIPRNIIEKINSDYLMRESNHEDELLVDWLMGSCLLLRKNEFLKISGFDHRYFMYFEDVDLCYQYNRMGKKVLYYPRVSMIHLHEQESVKKINKLTFIHLKSMVDFYKKYYFEKNN